MWQRTAGDGDEIAVESAGCGKLEPRTPTRTRNLPMPPPRGTYSEVSNPWPGSPQRRSLSPKPRLPPTKGRFSGGWPRGAELRATKPLRAYFVHDSRHSGMSPPYSYSAALKIAMDFVYLSGVCQQHAKSSSTRKTEFGVPRSQCRSIAKEGPCVRSRSGPRRGRSRWHKARSVHLARRARSHCTKPA